MAENNRIERLKAEAEGFRRTIATLRDVEAESKRKHLPAGAVQMKIKEAEQEIQKRLKRIKDIETGKE